MNEEKKIEGDNNIKENKNEDKIIEDNNIEENKEQKIIGNYKILKVLIPENYNQCPSYKVRNLLDDQIYRMDKIELKNWNDRIKKKIEIISSMKSKYIVNYKEMLIEEKLNLIFLITEFYTNTLYNNIIMRYLSLNKYIPESDLLTYLFHIIFGLSQLHKNKIFNINLNSKNIYIDQEKNLKLNPYNDIFSEEELINSNDNQIVCPELANKKGKYSQKSDIWYFGLLIYEMCCLKNMKRKYIEDLNKMYKYIAKAEYEPIPSIYSREIYYLIKSCLQYYGNKRPNAEEIRKKVLKLKGSQLIDKKVELFKVKKKYEKNSYSMIENCEDYNQNLLKSQNYKKVNSTSNKINTVKNKLKPIIHKRAKTPIHIRNKMKNFKIMKNDSFTLEKKFKRSKTVQKTIDSKIVRDINNGIKISNFEASKLLSQFKINKYHQEELSFYNKRIESPLLKIPIIKKELKKSNSANYRRKFNKNSSLI